MPSAVIPSPRAASADRDDLDNLFNYDDAVDDFLKDLNPNADSNGNDDSGNARGGLDTSKDMDEEIKVTRRRAPAPKLDDNRILSQAGIPKLRRISKTRLKFRGKGHEFADISRMLNMYQLWLDDLYPRAKFKDGLTIIEKLGHSKKMQMMRKMWIDDSKPRASELRDPTPEPESIDMTGSRGVNDGEAHADDRDRDIFGNTSPTHDHREQQRSEVDGDAPEEDELDALLANGLINPTADRRQQPPRQHVPFEEDDPDEDELDALMAENDMAGAARLSPRRRAEPDVRTDFDDEEEAMMSMGGTW